jgi:putative addiction module antidote
MCHNFSGMTRLKVTQIGNSLGVILPKDIIAQMNVEKGDELFLTKTPDGVALSPYDKAFEDQMGVLRQVMKKRRAALRELAK